MSQTAMREMTIDEVARELKLAFQVADIDPAKDTIVEASRKFGKLGLRHLVLYLSTGGFLCLCSDAEMSRRFKDAVEKISSELDCEDADIAVEFTGDTGIISRGKNNVNIRGNNNVCIISRGESYKF